MKPEVTLRHRFVEFIPETLDDGVIYVSVTYATAAHKCCCGCGHEVVTPFSPTDWKLTFDGATISLDPSIGNWSFPCQSHYWIKRNRVRWAAQWSQTQIEAGRLQDAATKRRETNAIEAPAPLPDTSAPETANRTIWQRIKSWIRG